MTPSHGRPHRCPPIAAPSILSADFSRLARGARDRRSGARLGPLRRHGPPLRAEPHVRPDDRGARCAALTPAFLDVHLMIEQPERFVAEFREGGRRPDHRASRGLRAIPPRCSTRVRAQRRARGARAQARARRSRRRAVPRGARPAARDDGRARIRRPGVHGGHAPQGREAPRGARRARRAARYLIEVDGGIAPDTARVARAAGAEVFVAGHAVFRAPDPRHALAALRAAIV